MPGLEVAAGTPHRAGRGTRRWAVRAAPRRVRAGLHAGARAAGHGHRRAGGGEVLAGAPRAAGARDRGLRRSRLGRPPHDGALERLNAADPPVLRHEDRAALLLSTHLTERKPLRQRKVRQPVPGAAWADGLALVEELPQ